MLRELINHSTDLLRLQNEGYELEVRDAVIIIRHIPYLTASQEIKYGILVSPLTISGNQTGKPQDHVISWQGEFPHRFNGEKLIPLMHEGNDHKICPELVCNFKFSNRPKEKGFSNYYDKFISYINIISYEAIAKDSSVTAKTNQFIISESENVFKYLDTNSSRAGTIMLSEKLKMQKIAIIGLGGTGSYVLDFVSKTPVAEIHLFDGDDFLQHNAFRAPGAASEIELKTKYKKTDYFMQKYSNMHKSIISNNFFIDEKNVNLLEKFDYVFLCIDSGVSKSIIIDYLINKNIIFIDTGIAVENKQDQLNGTCRVTVIKNKQKEIINKYISMANNDDDIYASNIQIAELNCLCATLAIIEWKKLCGFYLTKNASDFNFIYETSDGDIFK